jgi:CysZ protein
MRFVVDAARGFQLAVQGVAFLGRHRVLWKWALLPTIINIIVFAAAFALFLAFYADLYTFATSFLPRQPPPAWYAWLWVAPLRLLAWGIGLLLLVTALVVLYFAFLILGTMIAAPFLDVLAQRVEALVTGRPLQDQTTLLDAVRNIGLSITEELRKLGFFLAVQMTLLLLGLIPVLTPFTAIAATLFTMLFLPLEYAGFAMDHRQLRFRQRRALIWQHRWLMLGFGAAAFLTLLIPFLNFICLSVLVVGGTLLILDTENTSGGRITRH